MSDDGPVPDVEPDGFVRTALQLLPIPAHDDDFWARLDTALEAEGARARAGPAPSSRRRRPDATEPATRGRARSVARGGAARLPTRLQRACSRWSPPRPSWWWPSPADPARRRRGTTVGTADPAADAALETLVQDAQSAGTVTTLPAAREDESSEAVLQWVDDLGEGDAEAAWTAMGDGRRPTSAPRPSSQGLMTDLAEGYGAWSAAEPDEVLVTPVAAGDEGTIAVVTLIGTVEQEGAPEPRADAVPGPHRRRRGGPRALRLGRRPRGGGPGAARRGRRRPAAVGTDEELVFVLPSDAEAPVLRIDGGDTVICGEADGTELSDLDQAAGQRCAYLPEGGFAAGPHTVTIAFLGPDGDSITAESVQFDAA